jgi:HSP20 family protein
MALIKWEPLRDIEDLFGHSLAWPLGRAQSMLGLGDWSPRVDISESNGSYIIKADIPGVAKEDLKVTLDNGVLTIQGERKQDKEEVNKRFHRIERFYGSFSRSFSLPEDAEAKELKATAQEGQLVVSVPRKAVAPSAEAVQVPIE